MKAISGSSAEQLRGVVKGGGDEPAFNVGVKGHYYRIPIPLTEVWPGAADILLQKGVLNPTELARKMHEVAA